MLGRPVGSSLVMTDESRELSAFSKAAADDSQLITFMTWGRDGGGGGKGGSGGRVELEAEKTVRAEMLAAETALAVKTVAPKGRVAGSRSTRDSHCRMQRRTCSTKLGCWLVGHPLAHWRGTCGGATGGLG
eukprot:6962194-Prymnesium_polylepis.1